MRATGNGRLIGSMTCFIAVLILLAPGWALADDLSDAVGSTEGVVEDTVDVTEGVVEDTVDVTEGVVEDTVEDVTEVVTEVVNEVTETANDGTGDVTTAVDDVVDGVNDATNTATNDVSQVGDAATGITGTAGGSSGSDSAADSGDGREGSGAGGRERAGFLITISRAGEPRSRQWEPVNSLGVGLSGTSTGPLLQTAGESDRCEGPRSVCLDLLFGQGEFVKLGSNVLGILATTGIAVIELMILALVLGVSGSGALVAARERSSFPRPAG